MGVFGGDKGLGYDLCQALPLKCVPAGSRESFHGQSTSYVLIAATGDDGDDHCQQ